METSKGIIYRNKHTGELVSITKMYNEKETDVQIQVSYYMASSKLILRYAGMYIWSLKSFIDNFEISKVHNSRLWKVLNE